MKSSLLFALGIVLSTVAFGETLTGFPFQDESLRFSANWPGGVSLGQARMQARHTDDGNWNLELTLDASIPGLTITDRYHSIATPDLCSVEFKRESTHGSRKSRETITFAQDKQTAHRVTTGGGSSDFTVPDCARDALAFLYYTRREMGQGRVPLPVTIVMGGLYDLQLEYKGEEAVRKAPADRVTSTAHGPKSNVTFDLLFARDPARTPLSIRAPFALGTFSLELTR